MKIKSVEMFLLFDFYGDILTEKQRQLFDLYYNEDMSLAEISQNVGITRQGVRDSIIHSEQILTDLESKLGLVARYGNFVPTLQNVFNAVNTIKSINQSNCHNSSVDKICTEVLADLSNMSKTDSPCISQE